MPQSKSTELCSHKVNLPASCEAQRLLCHKVNLPRCVATRPCHKVNLPASCVARRPLFHKVNLARCEAQRHYIIMTCDIFGTGQTNILARQLQKSDRINSNRQSGSDQLGSNKKIKIK